MGLLQTLGLVKMDSVDGIRPTGATGKQDQIKTKPSGRASSPAVSNAGADKNSCNRSNSITDNNSKMDTEMKGERRDARGRFCWFSSVTFELFHLMILLFFRFCKTLQVSQRMRQNTHTNTLIHTHTHINIHTRTCTHTCTYTCTYTLGLHNSC